MRTTASGRGRDTSGLQILEEKTKKECYKRQNQNWQRKDLFNLRAAIYKKHWKSKISKMTRFQVWDQALSTRSVSYCRGEVIKKTCTWIYVRSLNHSKPKNPQSSGCRSRPLPRKTKTKKTKWTQKWKNEPLGNPHTSIKDQDSTVRGTWKVNSHFTSALSTVFRTDRLNAFNPTTVIWMELSDTSIPHFSQAAEANPSSAPFRLPDSSKLQNHRDVQETLDLLQRTTKSSLLHSLPCSPLLFFRLTLRKGLQGIFLS